MLAVQAAGSEVTTIEGLAPDGGLGTLQQAMWDSHSFQCGFCTPGFVMQATAFLRAHPDAGRAADPRGAVRQHLPVHRLPEHHRRRPAGRRAQPAALSEGAIMAGIVAERYTGASIKRSEDPRILTGRGPVRRRHQAAGDAARRVRALAAGARPRARGGRLGRAGAARGRRGVHRARNWRR